MFQLTQNIIAVELPDDAPTDKKEYFFHQIYSFLQYYKPYGAYYDRVEAITKSGYWDTPDGDCNAQVIGVFPLSEHEWQEFWDVVERNEGIGWMFAPYIIMDFKNGWMPLESGINMMSYKGLDLSKNYAIIKIKIK